MVEYWHWHSIHAGQETYWKGVLSHDLQPNRAYAEVSRVAHELQRIGLDLANMKIHNDVAILYSVDSANGLRFMPVTGEPASAWQPGRGEGEYAKVLAQLHQATYDANIGTDIVFPKTSAAELANYKVLLVPPLYIADDALLRRLSDYVRQGGRIVMTFKSGFANENSAARAELAPGPLSQAAGFTYQEFSNLETPLSLRGDPFHVGEGANQVTTWAEFLKLDSAKPLAFYDHPFFGRWPAIAENYFGKGTLVYEGTVLSDALQKTIVLDQLHAAGLTGPDQTLPAGVRVKHGTSHDGRKLHYYLNYSGQTVHLTYSYAPGTDLLTGTAVKSGEGYSVGPWDLLLVKETVSGS